MAFDPFQLDSGRDYSPDKFYTRATNQFDHGTIVNVKVPDQILGQIAEIIDRFPDYKSSSSFIRDAIVHRLEYLARHEPQIMLGLDIQEVLAAERAECAQDKYIAAVESQRQRVATVRTTLQQMEQAGEWSMMNGFLENVVPEVRDTLDEHYAEQIDRLVIDHTARMVRVIG